MGKKFSSAILLILFFISVPGCGTSEKTQYYLLRPMTQQAASVGNLSGSAIVVGLGPIRLPEYLNRPQIVTTSGTSKLELSEFHRWAEPLDQNFSRILAENLSAQLPENRIIFFPWDRATRVDCQIKVSVLNFSGDSGRRAVLDARWSVIREGKVIVENHSVFEQPLKSVEYEELVTAQSRTVADLSRTIAEAVRNEKR